MADEMCTTSNYGFDPEESLTCTVFRDEYLITLKLSEDSMFSSVGFFIAGVLNPDAAYTTKSFTIELYNELDELIDTTDNAGSNKFAFDSLPDQLESVNFENSNDVVGEYGLLSVTIVNTHPIIGGGTIKMTFPKWDRDV